MATDGVKIIDGDYAHDVYHTFMDLYDAGASLEEIRATVEQLNSGDDFDTEIFITAYALALWEIRELTDEVLLQVQQVIERGAFVKYLVEEEGSPGEARKRQQVLDRFWQKINQPNPKFRRRKNHTLQKKFVFNEGDVVVFQMPDGSYRATILLLISQHKGQCSYKFAISTYTGTQEPALSDIISGDALGGPYLPLNRTGLMGFSIIGIGHKHLRTIAHQFQLIGRIAISPETCLFSSMGGAMDFNSFASNFTDFNGFSGEKKTRFTHPKQVASLQQLLEPKSGA